ncbi:MAG TPA: OpgC domain-containing protein [Granulicella sp.]
MKPEQDIIEHEPGMFPGKVVPSSVSESGSEGQTAHVSERHIAGHHSVLSRTSQIVEQVVPRSLRQPELDALRGLLLLWMTLTHLPTKVSEWANQPFGFVSAAEGFVFLSALLTGKLHGRLLEANPAMLRAKLWGRALRVYGYHLSLLAFAFTVGASLAEFLRRPMLHNLLDFYFAHPVVAVLSSLLLIYCPPLLDILPMYVLFLLFTPFLLLGTRRLGWPVVLKLSWFVWIAAQFGLRKELYLWLSYLTHRNIPMQAMGAFNLFAWQFLWVAGIWVGARIAAGRNPMDRIPRYVYPWAVGLAVIFACLRRDVPVDWFNSGRYASLQDKWSLGPLRLLDFLCIGLLLWAGRSWLKRSLSWKPLSELGKSSLQVFSAHVIFVFIGLALIYEDAGEQVEGWEARLLILGTLIGLFSIALLWKRNKRKTVSTQS